MRSSPERDGEIDFVAVDAKPMVIDTETVSGPPSVYFLSSQFGMMMWGGFNKLFFLYFILFIFWSIQENLITGSVPIIFTGNKAYHKRRRCKDSENW